MMVQLWGSSISLSAARRRSSKTTVPRYPVAGISHERAHGILFALCTATQALGNEGESIVDLYLESYFLVSASCDMILARLRQVDFALRFWRDQSRRGGHSSFLLLRRGPRAFFLGLFNNIKGALGLGGAARDASISAADEMERRIIVLQRLRGWLLTALAAAHDAGAVLASVDKPQPRDRWREAARRVQTPRQPATPTGAGGSGAAAAAVAGPGPASGGSLSSPRAEGEEASLGSPSHGDAAPGGPMEAGEDPGAMRAAAAASQASVAGAAQVFMRARATTRRASLAVLESTRNLAIALDAMNLHISHVVNSREAEFDYLSLRGGTGAATPAGPPPLNNAHLQHSNSGSVRGAAGAGGAATPSTSQLIASVERLRTALGARYTAGPSGASAYAALQSARVEMSGYLLELPAWLRAPSRLQQNWLAVVAAGALGAAGVRFIYKNSRLAGSDNLDRWTATAVTAVKVQWKERVTEPLVVIRDELFSTFRARESITTEGDLQLSKTSLLKMLREFEKDYRGSSTLKEGAAAVAAEGLAAAGAVSSRSLPEGSEATEEQLLRQMALLMAVYESELRHPLRNMLGGQLARAMLIQVQKLKVDTEAAMLEIDKILRANELTLAMTAALPALLVLGGVLGVGVRALTPSGRPGRDREKEAVDCRLALNDLERVLTDAVESSGGADPAPGHGGAGGAGHVDDAEVRGAAVAAVAALYRVLSRAYRGGGLLLAAPSGLVEWRSIERDLIDLASGGAGGLGWGAHAAQRRLRIVQRMQRTYTVFARK